MSFFDVPAPKCILTQVEKEAVINLQTWSLTLIDGAEVVLNESVEFTEEFPETVVPSVRYSNVTYQDNNKVLKLAQTKINRRNIYIQDNFIILDTPTGSVRYNLNIINKIVTQVKTEKHKIKVLDAVCQN